MGRKLLLLGVGLAFVLVGCAAKLPPGDEWLKEPPYGGGEAVCLSEEMAETGLGRVLEDIPRPLDPRMPRDDYGPDEYHNMNPTPLTDLCPPPSTPEEACNPDASDYLLVATDVRVGQIYLGPDRLIAKQYSQLNVPGFSLPAKHENRLYRAYCGDACYSSSLSEGYRGTFYCDFILYLKSNDETGGPLLGHPILGDEWPPDDAVFDIYFRRGAEIPDKIRCKDDQAALNIQAEAQEGNQFFLNFNGERWFYRDEGTVKKKDLMEEKPVGSRQSLGETEIPELGEGMFVMYADLFFDAPEDEEELILYAVHEDDARDVIDNNNADGETRIAYYEFQKATEWKPGGKTLQLGTFAPPITAGWFKTWLTESKPAVYLYPEQKLSLDIKLNPAGRLTVSEPEYPPGGWQGVVAHPDGRLEYQGRSYPYLYYEADLEKVFVGKEGFVVKGEDLVSFFKEMLPGVGLNQWETADFIQYWMDRLNRNQPYYFVHFLSVEQIEKLEPLNISVNPDTEIRVRPYFEPLDELIEVKAQVLGSPPERRGFTLVEWGGILDGS